MLYFADVSKKWSCTGFIFISIDTEHGQIQLWYDQFHNILRRFDVLPNLPFTTSETMGDDDL